jgi:hypothetical protein
VSGRIAVILVALLLGCQEQGPAPQPTAATQPSAVVQPSGVVQPSEAGASPIAQAPRRALPPGAVEPPTLPEDPEAGARATAQWREHLAHEEEERQMFFDRPRLAQHRAIARTLEQVRARYDRAKTERAVERARQAAAHALEDVARRVKALDPQGVNSRLLPNYAALQAVFGSEYAEARLAALRGDAAPLTKAREIVEPSFGVIEKWLEEAAGEDDEEEREREREKAR